MKPRTLPSTGFAVALLAFLFLAFLQPMRAVADAPPAVPVPLATDYRLNTMNLNPDLLPTPGALTQCSGNFVTAVVNPVQNICNDAVGWLNATHEFGTAKQIAGNLFASLLVIEFFFIGVQHGLFKNDVGELMGSIAFKVLTAGLLLAVISNADVFFMAIINGFAQVGQSMGQSQGDPDSNTMLATVLLVYTGLAGIIGIVTGTSQEADWAAGLSAPWAVGAGTGGGDPGPAITQAAQHSTPNLLLSFLALSLLMAAGVILLQYVLLSVESYIVIFGGIVFLGFAGTRFTMPYAQGYMSYAFNNGARQLAFFLVLSVQYHYLPNLVISASAAAYGTTASGPAIFLSGPATILLAGIVVQAAIMAALSWFVPNIAGSFLSGGSALSAQGMMGTMSGMMSTAKSMMENSGSSKASHGSDHGLQGGHGSGGHAHGGGHTGHSGSGGSGAGAVGGGSADAHNQPNATTPTTLGAASLPAASGGAAGKGHGHGAGAGAGAVGAAESMALGLIGAMMGQSLTLSGSAGSGPHHGGADGGAAGSGGGTAGGGAGAAGGGSGAAMAVGGSGGGGARADANGAEARRTSGSAIGDASQPTLAGSALAAGASQGDDAGAVSLAAMSLPGTGAGRSAATSAHGNGGAGGVKSAAGGALSASNAGSSAGPGSAMSPRLGGAAGAPTATTGQSGGGAGPGGGAGSFGGAMVGGGSPGGGGSGVDSDGGSSNDDAGDASSGSVGAVDGTTGRKVQSALGASSGAGSPGVAPSSGTSSGVASPGSASSGDTSSGGGSRGSASASASAGGSSYGGSAAGSVPPAQNSASIANGAAEILMSPASGRPPDAALQRSSAPVSAPMDPAFSPADTEREKHSDARAQMATAMQSAIPNVESPTPSVQIHLNMNDR